MSESRDIFDFSELARLVCICGCGTEITLDAAKDTIFQDKCPSCGQRLQPMFAILETYSKLLRTVKDSGLNVKIAGPTRIKKAE
jgi:hypothetical protein